MMTVWCVAGNKTDMQASTSSGHMACFASHSSLCGQSTPRILNRVSFPYRHSTCIVHTLYATKHNTDRTSSGKTRLALNSR